MLNALASILVLATGLYLVGLAVASLWSPSRVTRFLGGFATSARTHYLELVLRFIAGGAFVLYAPHMLYSGFFVMFGWVLVITTVGLLAVPWRWHHRFAQRTVPHVTDKLWLVAIASSILGGFIMASAILGGGMMRR